MRMPALKPYITWKYSEKRKKQQTTENQKSTKPKYKLSGVGFLHLACQGGGSHPCSHVSYATGEKHTTIYRTEDVALMSVWSGPRGAHLWSS